MYLVVSLYSFVIVCGFEFFLSGVLSRFIVISFRVFAYKPQQREEVHFGIY